MSLNEQMNSFKARMRSAPVLGKRTVTQAPPPPPAEPEPKKPKLMSSLGANSGAHINTQFVHAVEFLKKLEKPCSLEDLEGYLSSPVTPLLPLFERNAHIRLQGNEVTYISKLGIYSAADLLKYLHNMPTFEGLSVRELKDGWSGALPAIANLEAEQKIIVLRNKKDESPRLIWPNKGGPIGKIDPTFVRLWKSCRVPSESELPKTLEMVGLKPSSVDPAEIKKNAKPQAEKKRKQRAPRSKITNTHMKGLLKDFS